MAENSAIEWCDHTFNPWEGCQEVGPGCDHCYAAVRNARFGGGSAPNWGPGAPRRRTSTANWRKPRQWQAAAAQFLAEHGRRQRVFCASLADVFDNAVDPAWRADLFALIRATPDLDWLLLTKRIGNSAAMAEAAGGWPPNVWLGATIVTQAEADRDVPKLFATAGPRVRFLSMEPLLEAVTFRWASWVDHRKVQAQDGGVGHLQGLKSIDWVIVGGESGPQARPMHPDWARSLRDECSAASVPFLFKQWGDWLPWEPDQLPYFKAQDGQLLDRHALPDFDDPDLSSWTDSLFYEGSEIVVHQRVGKARAGRLLDNVAHDSYPSSSGGEPDAAPLTDLDDPAPVRAGLSAPKAALSKRALAAAKPETRAT